MTLGELLVALALVAALGTAPMLIRAVARRRVERLGREPEPPRPWVLVLIVSMMLTFVAAESGLEHGLSVARLAEFAVGAAVMLFFFARAVRQRNRA